MRPGLLRSGRAAHVESHVPGASRPGLHCPGVATAGGAVRGRCCDHRGPEVRKGLLGVSFAL